VFSGADTGSATTPESVAKTKSDFLNLLTAGLKNQDPTNPTKNGEFMQQITSINSLEQQLNSNTKLDALVKSQTSSALTAELASSVNYIGKSAEVENDVFTLKRTGEPKLGYDVPKGTTNSVISISNERGTVIGSYKGKITEGKQNLSWDGKDADGNRLPAGSYKISVSLTDSNNKVTNAKTYVFGDVTSVELQDGKASVVIDDSYVLPISKVRSLEEKLTA
jgi:flagellar basal-body rod modification protein FlgD